MRQIIWLGQSLIIFLGPKPVSGVVLAGFRLVSGCFVSPFAALIYSAQLNANAVVCAC